MVATDSILDRIWIGTPGNMFPLVHPDLGGLLYNVHMYNVTSKPDFQSCSGSATLPQNGDHCVIFMLFLHMQIHFSRWGQNDFQ